MFDGQTEGTRVVYSQDDGGNGMMFYDGEDLYEDGNGMLDD